MDKVIVKNSDEIHASYHGLEGVVIERFQEHIWKRDSRGDPKVVGVRSISRVLFDQPGLPTKSLALPIKYLIEM